MNISDPMNERRRLKLVDVSKFQNYWTSPLPEQIESYVSITRSNLIILLSKNPKLESGNGYIKMIKINVMWYQTSIIFITGKVYHYMLEKSRIARQEKVHKFCIMLMYSFVSCHPEGVGWEEWHSTPFAVLIYRNNIRWSESTAVFLQVYNFFGSV